MQVLECYAFNEEPPEKVTDETQPDVAGMNKNLDAIVAFRVSQGCTSLRTHGMPCYTVALCGTKHASVHMLYALFDSCTLRIYAHFGTHDLRLVLIVRRCSMQHTSVHIAYALFDC